MYYLRHCLQGKWVFEIQSKWMLGGNIMHNKRHDIKAALLKIVLRKMSWGYFNFSESYCAAYWQYRCQHTNESVIKLCKCGITVGRKCQCAEQRQIYFNYFVSVANFHLLFYSRSVQCRLVQSTLAYSLLCIPSKACLTTQVMEYLQTTHDAGAERMLTTEPALVLIISGKFVTQEILVLSTAKAKYFRP